MFLPSPLGPKKGAVLFLGDRWEDRNKQRFSNLSNARRGLLFSAFVAISYDHGRPEMRIQVPSCSLGLFLYLLFTSFAKLLCFDQFYLYVVRIELTLV